MKDYRYSASLYLGETTGGREMPVFFDLHSGIANNQPPGCLITGAPGSGKTYLASTLTAMSAIMGKTTVVLDPKGDFLTLENLKDEIGQIAIWNLAKGRPGLLDPFYMAEDESDKLTLVIEVIDLFVGGLKREELGVLSPIVRDIIAAPDPSLQKVVDHLRGSQKPDARNLGVQLELFRKMEFAKLCFAPGNRRRQAVSINEGLTVITLVGLELPKSRENMTNKERLASGILFLLTDFIRRIMHNDQSKNPKTIVIDEAHAVIASDVGARTIRDMALLGRSKDLALLLVTQSQSHLDNLNIENTISTRFAFRSDKTEAEAIISAMNLPENEGFEEIILNLKGGETLMKDWMKRYATVKISSWRSDWNEAFKTNPRDKILREAKEAERRRREAQEAQRSQAPRQAPPRPRP